jgi:hypothetical protein
MLAAAGALGIVCCSCLRQPDDASVGGIKHESWHGMVATSIKVARLATRMLTKPLQATQATGAAINEATATLLMGLARRAEGVLRALFVSAFAVVTGAGASADGFVLGAAQTVSQDDQTTTAVPREHTTALVSHGLLAVALLPRWPRCAQGRWKRT